MDAESKMARGGEESIRGLCGRIRRWAGRHAAHPKQPSQLGKAVAVVGFFSDDEEKRRLQRTFDRFNYPSKQLYLYPAEREGELYDISNGVDQGLVACIHADYDYPAPYLSDMLAACDGPQADVVWTSDPGYPVGTFAEVPNPDIYSSIIPAHVLRLFYSRSNRHIKAEGRGPRSTAVQTSNCAVGAVEKRAFPNPLRRKNAIYGLLDYAFRMDRRCIESYLDVRGLGTEGLGVDYDRFLQSLTPIQYRYLLYFLNTNRAGERVHNHVSQHLELDPKQAVLDVGSGYGGLVKAFAQRGHPTTGLEILQSLMHLAEINLRGYDAELVLGDFLADEPKLAGYDLVTMTDVIEHLADVEEAIGKTVAVLNESGYAYVRVPNHMFVDYVREDPHTGLFGITLLRHDDASAYLKAARNMTYSVGEYYDYEYYIQTFEKYGATLVKVDNTQRPLGDAPQLIAACEAALEEWEGRMELPAEIKSDLRERAQKYIAQFKAACASRPDEVFMREYMTSHWSMFFQKDDRASSRLTFRTSEPSQGRHRRSLVGGDESSAYSSERSLPMEASIQFLRSPESLADIEHSTHKWDREWIAYWGRHKSYAFKYFLDLSAKTAEDFGFPRERIPSMSEEQFYHFKPFEHYAFAIWVKGALIPDSTIVELGCGPGLLGKVIAHFCRQYIGIDYSKLALYLATLVSPPQCRYLHLSQYEEIEALGSSADICVGRYFFIHQNLRNSLWILTLFNYLLRPGGIVSADFYASPRTRKGPQIVLSPEEELREEYPSAVVEYTEHQIRYLAARCGLTVDEMFYCPEQNARFVIFVKPHDARVARGEGVVRIGAGQSLPPTLPTPAPVVLPSMPPEELLGEPVAVEFTPPMKRWLGRWNYRTKVEVLTADGDGLRLEATGTQDTSGGQYAGIQFPVDAPTALRLDLSLVSARSIQAVFVDGYDRAGSRVARWRWRVADSPPDLGRLCHVVSPSHILSADRWESHFVADGMTRLQDAVTIAVFLLLRPGHRAGMVLHRAEVFH